jgi:hypothetical protein
VVVDDEPVAPIGVDRHHGNIQFRGG